MTYRHEKANAEPWHWSDRRQDPRVPGMRVQRRERWVFIPDNELLNIATQIADYLEARR